MPGTCHLPIDRGNQTNKKPNKKTQIQTSITSIKTPEISPQEVHGIQGTHLLLFKIEHLYHSRNMDFNLKKHLDFVIISMIFSSEVEFDYTVLPRLPSVPRDFKAVFFKSTLLTQAVSRRRPQFSLDCCSYPSPL